MRQLAYVLSVLILVAISRQIFDEEIECLRLEDVCEDSPGPIIDDELDPPVPAYPSDSFIDEDDEPITA